MKQLLLIAVLLASGCARNGGDADNGEFPANRLKVVSLVELQRRPVRRTTTQPAIVHAHRQAEIHAKVSGYLKELKADIGQTVQANRPLAVLHVPEMIKARESQAAEVKRREAVAKQYEAEKTLAAANKIAAVAAHKQALALIQEAAAQLIAETRELERVKELVTDKSVAGRLQDEAEKRYAVAGAAKAGAEAAASSAKAKITVADAKIKVAAEVAVAAREETNVARKKLDELDEILKYATLSAPFDGVVTERNVDVGDLVRNIQTASDKPRQPLFTIVDLRKVRIQIMVPEHDAGMVKPGAEVSLKLRALSGYEFATTPTVTRMANMLDKATQTMLVEIEIDNTQQDGRWQLLPGMYGEATITLDRKQDALVLPAEAVRFDEKGNSTLYVVGSDETIRIVPVKTGVDFGDEIEIVSGISPSDRIVGPVIGRLKDGQKVRVR